MKVYITKKEAFTGKKNGVTYVKLSYIRPTGETGEVFTTEDKYKAFDVDETKFLSQESVKNVLAGADVVEVEYDQKGYVVGLE